MAAAARLVRVALVAGLLGACGSERATAPEPDPGAPITARAARFGTEVAAQQVAYPVARFAPEGPFHVSIELGGAASGTLDLRWAWEGQERTTAVPLDDGVRVDDTTFVAAELDVPALPIGVHELHVSHGGEALGRFPFEVGAPPDALPSRIASAQTARGATVDFHPVEPADTFAPGDPVFLTGCGDFGRATWIGVDGRVDGEVDEDGTQRLTLDADAPDTCFAFDFRPHEGWPDGEHEAVLMMNAREIGRYAFTVRAASERRLDIRSLDANTAAAMQVVERECEGCARLVRTTQDGDHCGPCDVALCLACLGGTGRCPSCQRRFDETRDRPPVAGGLRSEEPAWLHMALLAALAIALAFAYLSFR